MVGKPPHSGIAHTSRDGTDESLPLGGSLRASRITAHHHRAFRVPAEATHVSLSQHRLLHRRERNLEADLARRRRFVALKRAGDAALVVLASPLWVPVLLISWLAVRLLDGGPAVFTQERVGLNGVPFTMYKLRTMRLDAESDGPAFACEADSRVTRIGSFLRRTRLDELPQLLNVLRGDMSIIGPRPEQAVFVRQFERSIPGYGYRHGVRPGITGLAQVNQGYVADEDGTVTKVRYDLEYISRACFLLDLRIALRTFLVLVTGWGAR